MAFETPRKALSLRKYLRRRATGKSHPDHLLGGCAYHGPLGGDTAIRRVRRAGWPWCPILGPDTTIADDMALQAVFAAWAALGPDHEQTQYEHHTRQAESRWRASQMLQRLQTEGRRFLEAEQRKRLSEQRRQPPPPSGGPLSNLFAPQ